MASHCPATKHARDEFYIAFITHLISEVDFLSFCNALMFAGIMQVGNSRIKSKISHIHWETRETGAVLEENICRGRGKKGDDIVGRRPRNTGQNSKLPNQPFQPSKNVPLYNCLQVIILHTAAVTKDLGGKAQVWGPLLQRKTAPAEKREPYNCIYNYGYSSIGEPNTMYYARRR